MQKIERDRFLVEKMGWQDWNSIGDSHFYFSPFSDDPVLLPNLATWEGFGILLTWLKEQSPYFIGAVLVPDKEKPFTAIGLNTLSPSYQSVFLKDIDPDKFADAIYNVLQNPDFDPEQMKADWLKKLGKL